MKSKEALIQCLKEEKSQLARPGERVSSGELRGLSAAPRGEQERGAEVSPRLVGRRGRTLRPRGHTQTPPDTSSPAAEELAGASFVRALAWFHGASSGNSPYRLASVLPRVALWLPGDYYLRPLGFCGIKPRTRFASGQAVGKGTALRRAWRLGSLFSVPPHLILLATLGGREHGPLAGFRNGLAVVVRVC